MQVSAPGRADFLNTHQDYKGLPVVPVGLNLRTRIHGRAVSGTKVRVKSINLEREGQTAFDEFDIREIGYKEKGWFGNYIRAIVNALKKFGYSNEIKGAEIAIDSDIPVGAGLGSSGALEVATAKFFDAAFKLNLSKHDLAELSYFAEREELGIPCGRLDQYGSSYGGIIKLETRPPFKVEKLVFRSFFLTVINSGIRHLTGEIHPKRQRELDEGLSELLRLDLPKTIRAKLSAHLAEVLWENLSENELEPYLKKINEKNANRILYTLRSQRSTEVALKILRRQPVDIRKISATVGEKLVTPAKYAPRNTRSCLLLGAVINHQHELLRDLYELSLPKIEELREAAINAGAYGVKLSGAGMGGCLIAITKTERGASEVLKAVIAAGAANGWISKIDNGARIDKV